MDAFSESKGVLADRTKRFALRIIRLYSALPKATVAQTIGKQLLRSGTSIGANYREAMRARSAAEFSSKLQICLQESEETSYWLELLVEAELVNANNLADLMKETTEVTAMLVSSIRTIKARSPSKSASRGREEAGNRHHEPGGAQ